MKRKRSDERDVTVSNVRFVKQPETDAASHLLLKGDRLVRSERPQELPVERAPTRSVSVLDHSELSRSAINSEAATSKEREDESAMREEQIVSERAT